MKSFKLVALICVCLFLSSLLNQAMLLASTCLFSVIISNLFVELNCSPNMPFSFLFSFGFFFIELAIAKCTFFQPQTHVVFLPV